MPRKPRKLTPATPAPEPTPQEAPTQPEALTPAQIRAARARARAVLKAEQSAGHAPVLMPPQPSPPLPAPPSPPMIAPVTPPVTPQPARKRFHTHEVRRVPVSVTPEAQADILATTAQGRLFPLALSEAFGKHLDIVAVEVAIEPKRRRFPYHPELTHPVTGEEAQLLSIVARHADPSHAQDEEWLLNLTDLTQRNAQGHPIFDAAKTADMLLNLYLSRFGPRGERT